VQNDKLSEMIGEVGLSDLHLWRVRVLDALMFVVAVIASPVVLLTIFEAIRNPDQWFAAVSFTTLYLLLVLLVLARSVSFHLRAWSFLLLGYGASALSCARGGLAGDGRVFLLALPMLALILVGLRSGLIAAAMSLLFFSAFAVAAQIGWMENWLTNRKNPLALMDWVAGGATFAMFLVGLMLMQGRLNSFLIRLAREKGRLHKESESLRAFNENIVQSMGEGILLEDKTGCITFVNPKAAELVGSSAEEMVGRHWKAFVPPEHRATVQEEVDKRRQGIASRYEVELLAEGGRRVPVIVSARPLFEDGRLTGVLSVLADITERKRVEEALRESEAMAQAILNAITESIFLTDVRGIILALNQVAAERLNKDADELIGACIEDVFPPSLAESRRAMVEEAKLEDRPIRFEDEQNGRFFDTSVYPVMDSQGEMTRLAIFAQDITERKRWEQYTLHTERLAAMGRLAAALTHELNNPLQAIRSNLELVLDFDLEQNERREYLGVVRQEIERLTKVTQRVLGLARAPSDVRCPVSIADLTEKMLVLVDRELQESGIQVTADFPADLPAISAAPDQIFQVLLNLTINAIEAMLDGGRLSFEAWADGDLLHLTLTNDGAPLPEEHLEHIFDPFFTTKPDGTGLGLYISHNIVQQHGGRVRVGNRDDGRGVTFTLTLPVVRASELQGTVS